MNTVAEPRNWSAFFKLFTTQNHLRPTRLGVFEGRPEEMRDYWLENGLPLVGVDVDSHGNEAPTIEIILGKNEKGELGTLTHTVRRARSASITLSPDGVEDGLEIKDGDGNTTFLRFENERN